MLIDQLAAISITSQNPLLLPADKEFFLLLT
jgi:hypothetical protein